MRGAGYYPHSQMGGKPSAGQKASGYSAFNQKAFGGGVPVGAGNSP
jgi:hypothetical protein